MASGAIRQRCGRNIMHSKGPATRCDAGHPRWDVLKPLRCIKVTCNALHCSKLRNYYVHLLGAWATPGVHNPKTCALSRCMVFGNFRYDNIEINSLTYCRVHGFCCMLEIWLPLLGYLSYLFVKYLYMPSQQ